MVFDLKFTRFEGGSTWGFRLAGGCDFETPLTVTKVTKGGLAESFGMKVGDIVVRVNETPTSNLNHDAAHEVIIGCGNNFVMGILRPSDDEATMTASKSMSLDDLESCRSSNEDGLSPFQQLETPDSQAYSEMSFGGSSAEVRITSESVVAVPPLAEEITDDHIAELMSGEAEVLKEHNVLGVNFKKIMPKSGLFKSSEVFKHLNAEAVKTKAEQENEVKRWTTFLQKPDRPVPKSKADLELERKAATRYRIKICKQPKPRCAPNRTPSPPPVAPIEPEIVVEEVVVEELMVEQKEIDDTHTELQLVPGPEPQYVEYLTEPKIVVTDIDAAAATDDVEADAGIVKETIKEVAPVKSEEEQIIERQLADVQRQLLALSTLPLTIQATLDAVTKQLAELVPALRHQQSDIVVATQQVTDLNGCVAEEKNEQEIVAAVKTGSDVDVNEEDFEKISLQSLHGSDVVRDSVTDEEELVTVTERGGDEDAKNEDVDGLEAQESVDKQRMEKVYRKQEEEWISKREKEKKRLLAELEERRLYPRRLSKAQGGPLTPQERPLVLPGGRKWRNERDAFNEDFIAEIISSQAELIQGNTLGHTFESPLLGYDERVNFLKYKKPEKDLSNLDRSEVFKIIHNMEYQPRSGIQVRPPKVMAEEDVRKRATPISNV